MTPFERSEDTPNRVCPCIPGILEGSSGISLDHFVEL
jgi:hypothetical protein